MIENISTWSNVPAYLQIEHQVLLAVASGRLKGGDKLPALHELAEKLNVNANTIAKSYRDLEVMGIVYTRRGMGVFINKGIEAKCREDCRRRIVTQLHGVVAAAKAAGMSSHEMKEVCAKSYAFGGDPYGETPETVLALAKSKKS